MAEFQGYEAVNDKGERRVITIAAGPVIIHEDKVLLVKDDENLWKFPGGSVQDSEVIRDVPVREAKEELGVDVKLVEDIAPFLFCFQKEEKRFVLIHYQAELVEHAEEFLSPEGHEVRWFDYKNLPEDSQPNVKPAVDSFVPCTIS